VVASITPPEYSSFSYSLRADGKRASVQETVVSPATHSVANTTRTIGYSYDGAGRLTNETRQSREMLRAGGSNGSTVATSWSYDEASNRSSQTIQAYSGVGSGAVLTGTTTTNYAYNNNDQLTEQTVANGTTSNTTAYGYDANGNQTGVVTNAGTPAASTSTYGYDFENHLVAIGAAGVGGTSSGYTYDAEGHRLAATTTTSTGSTTKRFLVDANLPYAQVLEERDNAANLQARYSYGSESGPLRMEWVDAPNNRSGTSYFLGDGLDSTRQLTDPNAAITDSYAYDAWGNDESSTGSTPNRYRFNGQQQDATGNYYLRARYYNSGVGRFLNHDPLMGNADTPITQHRYLYAGNDPVNHIDPSGEDWSMSSVSSSMAIGATLGSIGGGIDGYLQGHRGWNLAFDAGVGAVVGAAGGRVAVSAYRWMRIALAVTGAVGGATSIADAVQQGNTGLAAFRVAMAVAGGFALREQFLNNPLGTNPNRGGLSSKGFGYAREKVPGGSGRAFEGHGEYRAGSGDTIVPEGTYVYMPREAGRTIPDELGFALARDDWDSILANPEWVNILTTEGKIYQPGEAIPNYTLKAPDRLRVSSESMVVEDATPLSDLLEPGQGFLVWAACSEYRR